MNQSATSDEDKAKFMLTESFNCQLSTTSSLQGAIPNCHEWYLHIKSVLSHEIHALMLDNKNTTFRVIENIHPLIERKDVVENSHPEKATWHDIVVKGWQGTECNIWSSESLNHRTKLFQINVI